MIDYVEVIEMESARVAEVARLGPLDAPIAACPGWDLAQLVAHLGYVQRWARLAVVTAAQPDTAAIGEPGDDVVGWLEEGSAALVTALRQLDLEGPTWHPFPVAQVAAVWPRRQAHEVFVHRWDAEQAVGALTGLDPHMSAAAIEEYFEVVVPRVVDRDGRTIPAVDLAIRCPDVGKAWFVDATSGRFPLLAADDREGGAKASLEAPAADVLLALWGRRELPAGAMSGDAAPWLAFGGN